MAIASSTRLSFRPIRRSPVMIFTMYLASRGVACARSSRTKCGLCGRTACAGDLAEAVRQRRAQSGLNCRALPGLDGRGRPCLRGLCRVRLARQLPNHRAGGTPNGEFRFAFAGDLSDYSPQQRAADLQEWSLPTRERVVRRGTPPQTDASSTVRDFRCSATIAVFSSFLVVPAIRSQASASLIMRSRGIPRGTSCLSWLFDLTFDGQQKALTTKDTKFHEGIGSYTKPSLFRHLASSFAHPCAILNEFGCGNLVT